MHCDFGGHRGSHGRRRRRDYAILPTLLRRIFSRHAFVAATLGFAITVALFVALEVSFVKDSFAKDSFSKSASARSSVGATSKKSSTGRADEGSGRRIELAAERTSRTSTVGANPAARELGAQLFPSESRSPGPVSAEPLRAGAVEVGLALSRDGSPLLDRIPPFKRRLENHFFGTDALGRQIRYTIDAGLNDRAEEILRKRRPDWAALVAIRPQTGDILALADFSAREADSSGLTGRATFPAASLIKVVTAAAAVEHGGMRGSDLVPFRGGNYTLERYNYLPDPARDRRSMSLEDALARSVNPVFAHVALSKLNLFSLRSYAERFGFNSKLPYDFPVERSSYSHLFDDYSFARTAAGFGPVYISPIHAAVIAASLANGGVLVQPHLISEVRAPSGEVVYQSGRVPVRRVVSEETSDELMRMMRSTVAEGTARRAFGKFSASFHEIPVAGKTGTLSGENPKGMYYWFLGAAPAHAPEVAVAGLVIANGHGGFKGSHAAADLLEFYFRRKFGMPIGEVSERVYTAPAKKKKASARSRSRYRSIGRPTSSKRSALKSAAPKKTLKKSVVGRRAAFVAPKKSNAPRSKR